MLPLVPNPWPNQRIRAHRIVRQTYTSTAFDGEGARRHGGRWNSKGTRMVYTSSSLSLATLELLVHLEDVTTLYGRYDVISVDFDSELVAWVDETLLPRRWNSPRPIAETQALGDAWIASRRSPILAVPSAVTVGELDYLLAPEHPDFAAIELGEPQRFEPDARLG